MRIKSREEREGGLIAWPLTCLGTAQISIQSTKTRATEKLRTKLTKEDSQARLCSVRVTWWRIRPAWTRSRRSCSNLEGNHARDQPREKGHTDTALTKVRDPHKIQKLGWLIKVTRKALHCLKWLKDFERVGKTSSSDWIIYITIVTNIS